jgi:hypothetical protein
MALENLKGSNYYVTYMTDWFCDELFSGFQLVKTFPGITRGPNHFAGRQDISIYRRNGDSR